MDILLPNPQGTAQGLGSAISYMRRYDAVTTLLDWSLPDDDGAAASRISASRRHNPRRAACAPAYSHPQRPMPDAAPSGAALTRISRCHSLPRSATIVTEGKPTLQHSLKGKGTPFVAKVGIKEVKPYGC